MAQKVHIVLEDDLDGSEATETVSFGLDGTSYEIDLNEDNATKLREALAIYVGHARKVSGGARRGGGRRATGGSGGSGGSSSAGGSGSAGGASAKEIREWARSNGYEVPERGRIPADVRSAYDSAN
jgi:hypothetical protein